ncbi:MAG: hypothetical protein ACKPKO_59405 [Candidatus Fonsibacter sp.]
MTEFLALNPKVYSINYQSIDEFSEVKEKNKKTLKRCIQNCGKERYKS